MKIILNRTLLSMILVGLLTTISCQTQVETISQTQMKLERYAVTIHDLPQGWIYSGENWTNSFGGEDYTRGFDIPNNTNGARIGLGHTMSIYPDEKQAEAAYPQWEDYSFGGLWNYSGAEFVPSDPNDQYEYKCQQILQDKSIIGCRFLQRHNQFIVYVSATIDGKAMTLAQLNQILGVLDKRLNETSMGN